MGFGSEAIRVIPYEPRFERDLVEVCWKTGFMGTSLEGRGKFEDRRLFALLFVLQFPKTWPETCWVAVRDEAGKERAVGYIASAIDSSSQERDFHRLTRWRWRIMLRAFAITWWRHPESFKQLLAFASSKSRLLWQDPAYRDADYPACLHLNLLPDCQGEGVGTRLMECLLAELRRRGIPGVHLGTSDHNTKALPFYAKMGFRLVKETESEFWIGAPARGLDYALKLD